MKIIFDSEEEERKFINRLHDRVACPGMLKLPENCIEDENDDNICFRCWQTALKSEVKE